MCIITNLCNVFCSMWTTRPFPNEFGHATVSTTVCEYYTSIYYSLIWLISLVFIPSIMYIICFNTNTALLLWPYIPLYHIRICCEKFNQLKMHTITWWGSEKEKFLPVPEWRPPELWPTVSSHTPTHCWIMLIKIGLPLFPINYHICIIWVKRIKQFNAIHRTGINTVVVCVSVGEGEGLIIIYTVSGRVTVYGLFS